MKIYTEINYEWLDGQLVMTDSKSFEYDGELTLCNVDTGGGTVTEFSSKVTDINNQMKDAISDSVKDLSDSTGVTDIAEGAANLADTGADVLSAAGDTATGALETAIDTGRNIGDTGSRAFIDNRSDINNITSGLGDGLKELSDNTIGKAGDVIGEGITTGGEVLGDQLAIGGDTVKALGSVGRTLDDVMEPINEVGWGITDAGVRGFQQASDWVADKGQELTTFIHGSPSPKKIEVGEKKAMRGSLKGKTKTKFGAHKDKKRARKSLRIGK
jgi:hypothetical protein